MWIRLRLDIGWTDLLAGYFHGWLSRDFDAALSQAEACWRDEDRHTVVGLSVRTGLDLLFQTLKFPAGSEVLYSAITIRDMVSIAEHHQLRPIPIDLQAQDRSIDIEQIRRQIKPQTKAIVVAHLFGAIPNLDALIELAQQNDLFLIEDCAQAWCGRTYTGHPQADATLFSFGAIKTATALGGAIYHIRSTDVAQEVRARQSDYPIQTNRSVRQKAVKFGILKVISSKLGFSLLVGHGRRKGKSVDQVLGGLTKGFPGSDLLTQIRQRPAPAMLRLLARRMNKYRTKHLTRRIANARRLIECLKLQASQPELLDERHSFWLFPLRTQHPEQLLEMLRAGGFDATQFGRLEIVPAPEGSSESCPVAREFFKSTVFLPTYPGMTNTALTEMSQVILAVNS